MNKTNIQLIKELISIPSEAYNRKACNDVLESIKNELKGFQYKEFESNGIKSLLFTNTDENENHFRIILNAHIDVVPGHETQYTPIEKDGKLYGRGVYDMKASAATMIRIFQETAKKVNYPLGLQIVTDEEIGGSDGTNFQIQQGIKADFVLGGEHSGFKINNEAKGVILFQIRINGKTAHSSQPWAGENAAVKMGEVIYQLHKLLPIPEKEVWETTASVIKIETENNTVNSIPDNCTALINIRYIPEERRDLLKLIKKILPEGATLEVLFKVPPEYTAKDNPFVQMLAASITNVRKHPVEYLKTHGQSDLRYYHIHKTPAVNISPLGGNHHSADEWVSIKSLEDYYNILQDFLLSVNML